MSAMDRNGNREIPYGKPVRVGNFKVWRTKKTIGRGKERTDVEQVNVSTLDESWHVKIPATFEMVAMMRGLFSENTERRDGQLSAIFSNILYSSCVPNGYFQRALSMCAMAYADPGLLREDGDGHDEFMHDVRVLVSAFLEWRDEYDRQAAAYEPTDEEMRSEEVADEIAAEAGV